MLADGSTDNPRRVSASLFLVSQGMAQEVQGGDWRGTRRSMKVLSPVAAQALGWQSRISAGNRAKVLGLRLFWMPEQDTHNPPTGSGLMCV